MKKRELKLKFRSVSTEDIQLHIAGKQARRRRRARNTVKWLSVLTLGVAALSVGFLGTEALLRISETPLPPQQSTTQPAPELEPTDASSPARPGENPQENPLRSFYVPAEMLDHRTQARELMQQATRLGSDSVVFPMKRPSGLLTYRSTLPQVQKIQAASHAKYRTDWTLRDLKNKAGQRIIAVVHCFDDPYAAERLPEIAVHLRDTQSTPWKDAGGARWLDPYAPDAQKYLLGLVKEILSFGADDLLLCGVSFPEGTLESAVFATEEDTTGARNAILHEFLSAVKEQLGDTGKLYVQVEPETLLTNDERLALWAPVVDAFAVFLNRIPPGELPEVPILPMFSKFEEAGEASRFLILSE